MQIDKDKLQKILNLSEDELKKKVSDAVSSSGLEKEAKQSIDAALKNMKDLKKTLGNIDEESLKKAIAAVGVDKIEEIKKNLK